MKFQINFPSCAYFELIYFDKKKIVIKLSFLQICNLLVYKLKYNTVSRDLTTVGMVIGSSR